MWCPTSLMVNGVETQYPVPEPSLPLNFINSTGMCYEAEEVRRCLLNGTQLYNQHIPFLFVSKNKTSDIFLLFLFWKVHLSWYIYIQLYVFAKNYNSHKIQGINVCLQNHLWLCTPLPKFISSDWCASRSLCSASERRFIVHKETQNHFHRVLH